MELDAIVNRLRISHVPNFDVPYINNVYIHLHIIAIPGKAYNFRETFTFFSSLNTLKRANG